MMCQGSADAAARLVSGAAQNSTLTIAKLPKTCCGESHERESTSLLLDVSEHLVDKRVVFEAVAASERRLHERATEGIAFRGFQRRELGERS